MVVRELVGGIYFGKPKGFGKTEAGARTGYNTMIYSEPEVHSFFTFLVIQQCSFVN